MRKTTCWAWIAILAVGGMGCGSSSEGAASENDKAAIDRLTKEGLGPKGPVGETAPKKGLNNSQGVQAP